MDADVYRLSAVYDPPRIVAVLCGSGAGEKCLVGVNAVLCAYRVDVGFMVCHRLYLAFGSSGVEQGPWIGDLGNLFLAKVTMDSVSGSIPETLFVMFQLTFAVITPALIVGGFAERMRFSAMLIFCSLWMVLVYAPICHWVWGGGWLGEMGLQDFAGGAVVHITAGRAALVAAMSLGGRRGFGQTAMPPHNLTMTVTGAGMLWVGWFGFNAGSAVAADSSAAMAMLVTHLVGSMWRVSVDDDGVDPARQAVGAGDCDRDGSGAWARLRPHRALWDRQVPS